MVGTFGELGLDEMRDIALREAQRVTDMVEAEQRIVAGRATVQDWNLVEAEYYRVAKLAATRAGREVTWLEEAHLAVIGRREGAERGIAFIRRPKASAWRTAASFVIVLVVGALLVKGLVDLAILMAHRF